MDDDAVKDAIRQYPDDAASALLVVQAPDPKPLTADVVELLARRAGRDPVEVWWSELEEMGSVTPFVAALRARGVVFPEDVLEDGEKEIAPDKLARFFARARLFRCRILKDGQTAGTGILVGPNLVLTAWHVIAAGEPGSDGPSPLITVVLADDTTRTARLPAAFESACGDAEYLHKRAPRSDDEVVGRRDVALLELDSPAGAHLSYVSLPSAAPPLHRRGRIALVHSPEGEDAVGLGRVQPIRGVTARWRHDIETAGGSSGGACFDRDLNLIGVHQAAFDSGARFVPVSTFIDDIVERVRDDAAPLALWSLDDTADGPLVIGRRTFFEAVAAAGEPAGRVRGVRIKWAGGAAPIGLRYSYAILAQLVMRRGPAHRLVRILQDEIVDDMTERIRQTVIHSGIRVDERAAEPIDAQTSPEVTARRRAEAVVTDIEAAAAAAELTVWLFIDNPAVSVTESRRLVVEAFVDAALRQPHLRLVIAGMNDFAFAGAEFTTARPSGTDTAPGLYVEYLRPLRRADLVEFLALASRALTGDVRSEEIVEWESDRSLFGLTHVNYAYDAAVLPEVSSRVRLALRLLAEESP